MLHYRKKKSEFLWLFLNINDFFYIKILTKKKICSVNKSSDLLQ